MTGDQVAISRAMKDILTVMPICIVNFTTKIPEYLRKWTTAFLSKLCYTNINQLNAGVKQNGGGHTRGSEKKIQAYLIVCPEAKYAGIVYVTYFCCFLG